MTEPEEVKITAEDVTDGILENYPGIRHTLTVASSTMLTHRALEIL